VVSQVTTLAPRRIEDWQSRCKALPTPWRHGPTNQNWQWLHRRAPTKLPIAIQAQGTIPAKGEVYPCKLGCFLLCVGRRNVCGSLEWQQRFKHRFASLPTINHPCGQGRGRMLKHLVQQRSDYSMQPESRTSFSRGFSSSQSLI